MVLDCNVLAFDVARFAEAFAERGHKTRVGVRRPVSDKRDHRHRRLLRMHRKRPHCCRSAEDRDELAPSHSITRSARVSMDGGRVRPSNLAVFRFIASSNFVGRSTGKSAAFTPFSNLSTKYAARRNISAKFGPKPTRRLRQQM